MRRYREKFGEAIEGLFGGFEIGGAGSAAGPNLATVGTIAWVGVLVLAAVVSVAFAWWLPLFKAEVCIAIIWGIFIGCTLLFYWPPQLLITTVGGWIGIGSANFAGAADVVEKVSTGIQKITATLSTSNETTVYNAPGWILIVLIAVCCLPAYGHQQPGAAPPETPAAATT